MMNLYACEHAWYCLRALPKKEHLAATLLWREAGIEAIAPRIRFTRKTRTGKKTFVEAMFPGYVFAQTALRESYRRVLSTSGVCGVVSYGSAIPTIPDSFISEIKSRFVIDGGEPLDSLEAPLQHGEKVTVTEGPFIHWEGMVTGLIPSRDRVRVLLEILGQQLSAELPAAALLAQSRQTPQHRAWKS